MAIHAFDIDELLQSGEPIIFAVDQAPFDVETRGTRISFCLLAPLMTESGVEVDPRQFRNRERVWWMLRPDIRPEELKVGMIWSGPIEPSREHGSPGREKDHYQVRRPDIRPGVRQGVEVLNLKVADPNLTELLSSEGIPWPHPPLQRVVFRGGHSVLGPFRSRYDYSRERLYLQALSTGSPEVFRMPRGAFESEVAIREFSYTANLWDPKAQQRLVELALIHDRDLAVLYEKGEGLDGATDAQVVNWALELLEIPKRDRQTLKEILARSGQIAQKEDAMNFPGRLQRFQELCASRDRIVNLGSEIADAIARHGAFQDLVNRHLETITADRVARAIEERRAEIQKATAEAEERAGQLRKKIDGLQEEYARRLEAMEKELAEKQGARLREIQEREISLERQEKEMVERLEGLVETYRSEAKELGDRLLAQLPLLQRLGILDSSFRSATRHDPRPDPEKPLELPAFLGESRPRMGSREKDFLDQFENVVARQGFVFEREDLVNFHVLVLTCPWTVLTGPSGLGKSSLPRLYAEALGCAQEFLLVPVRPDWLDDREVIGAFNALSRRYEPAPCGLVERLICAVEDEKSRRGGIYLICLDEMNLARVEHYFAQFLSLIEQPFERRHLQLFAAGVADAVDPYAPYRSLRLGGNLRFIGTVNIDETTHFFSPKVIDRASIATFERPDLRLGLGDSARREPQRIIPVHLDDFLSWIRPPDREGAAVDLLVRIDEALRRSRLGLGFRRRDRILRYVASARGLLGEDRALDLALLQNLLPALRPSAPRYRELLEELARLLPSGRFQRVAPVLAALREDPESDFFQLL